MNFERRVPTLSRDQQIRILVLAVLAVVLVTALVWGLRAVLSRTDPPPPPLPPGELQLTRQQVSSLKIAAARYDDGYERTGATGQIAVDETRSTPVFLPYSGQVLTVPVQNGDHVRQGDVLLRIRTSDVVDARNALFAAEAQRASAASQLRVAQENAARAEQIYRTAGGALKDVQQARSDLVNAQSALRIAESAVGAAKDKLVVFGKTPGEIARLDGAGGIGGIHADTSLRAPISGVVVTRAVAEGQYVTGGGTTPAFVIADLSKVWLVAQVAESDAARVHIGDHLTVTTTAYPGREFDALIDNVAAQIDPVTHRLQVRATIANPDGALKPQMFADFTIRSPIAATIPAAPGPRLLALPSEAVIHEGDSARVWVYLGKGRVIARPVRTGESHDGRITILSGLRPGEQVVSAGALFVNEAGLD
ncbi:efflux RND transporter periplasmic adaptor subunit [Novosphingobium flavum]|uniref:Efflux RND transporter periplasmic adaptor subunit n=1 Tax=Novosphingobium aerophilum TaxID=2839843 RepID=A0A7X1FAU6_9SPHN|nr:efflux RND transporter periplasmic adaptor subunit [Novosphingobium aerophilum]MBC2653144.1 efflux RND transporter periplasmic adaptor subunit [Novosphingobium aerophilum]MBC2661551.1 efflux RND transporter periplasmic adaptor subunit [Novosphingobium aerophilum]